MDCIKLDGLDFFGYHGVLPEENKLGQRFIVDACMYLDLHKAGKNDDLTETVNYAEVYNKIKVIVEGETVKLIETLADRIASAVLGFDLVSSVQVTVSKPGAPINGIFGNVSVTVNRKKSVIAVDEGRNLPLEYAVTEQPFDVYLSLGSNMGNRLEYLQQAIDKLRKPAGIIDVQVSSFYETPPWGKLDQPPFLNCVVKLKCDYPIMELFHYCKFIEYDLDRVRSEDNHWGPRTIDIDMLCIDNGNSDIVVNNRDLILPHKFMLERAFVLVPLAELNPDLVVQGKSIAEHLAKLDIEGIKKIDVD